MVMPHSHGTTRLLKTVGPGDVTIIQPVSRRMASMGTTRVASLPLLFNWAIQPNQGDPKADVAITTNRVRRGLEQNVTTTLFTPDSDIFYGGAADGYLTSGYVLVGGVWTGTTSWDNALSGAETFGTSTTDTYAAAGTQPVAGTPLRFLVYQGYLSFDTSAIPASATITSATLSLYGYTDYSNTEFVVQVYAQSYGTLTSADWVDPRTIATDLLASYDTSDGWSTSAYNEFTSETAMLAAITKAGTTQFVVTSDFLVDGSVEPSAPTAGRQWVTWQTQEGSYAPKLEVAWTSMEETTLTPKRDVSIISIRARRTP